MIKYIYYRLCDKHHEKGKRKNVSSWNASRFAGTVYFMMLWPFTLFFSILMLSSNVFTFFLGFIPFIVLELYLSDRFEKRMQTYKPPKRYKALNHVSVYWLTIPTALIITAYFFAVLVSKNNDIFQLKKEYYADIVAFSDIIIELKSVSKITKEHRAQLFNYLRVSKKKCGVLINYGDDSFYCERYWYVKRLDDFLIITKDNISSIVNEK